MIWDVGVGEFEVVLHDEVALLLSLNAILPLDKRPAELCDNAMVPVPTFKIQGTPGADLGGPEGPDTLKRITFRIEGRIGALETFVIFLYFLARKRKVSEGVIR